MIDLYVFNWKLRIKADIKNIVLSFRCFLKYPKLRKIYLKFIKERLLNIIIISYYTFKRLMKG